MLKVVRGGVQNEAKIRASSIVSTQTGMK